MKARPTGARLAAAVAVLLLGPLEPARAQGVGSATLRGTVLDPSGAVLPGTALVLTAVRTRAVRTAVSDGAGGFVFAALTPGAYELRAELPGFTPWQSGEVQLSTGDSSNLNVTLAVGGLTDALTVVGQRDLLRSDHGAREGVITARQIQDLAILSRSALELLRILPGTVAPDQSSLEVVGFGGANHLGSYSVNGTRGSTINPVIDGSKIVDFGGNNSVMLNMNADMVDEVKIQSGNYAAEHGSAGVQVTAVTKSGASSFHGSVYDYWRNWRFAANDRSSNYAGVPRPRNDYQYPGFNLSGPVLIPGTDFNRDRDELFFFVGFELQRQILDPGTSLTVVPTAAQRRGDFSDFLSGGGQNLGQGRIVTIPAGFPGAGQPAPNNDLSPYVDPNGQALLNAYPLPNHTDPDNRYNFAFNPQIPVDRWQLNTRLDWNVSEATRAYLRLALEKETSKDPRGTWGCCASAGLPSRVVGDNRAWSVALNVTSVLSPDLMSEVIFSASRLELDNRWEDPSEVSRAALGMEGWQGVFPSESDEAPLGVFSLGQGLGHMWNQGGGLPIFAYNDSMSLSGQLTKVLGAHTLKFGGFAERGRKQQNMNTNTGQVLLGSPWTAGGTGSDYGDLLVGRMAQFNQATPTPSGEWRFWNVEGFVQDAWRIRRNLTLEAGLRAAKLGSNDELTGRATAFDASAYDRSQGPFIDGDPQRPNGILLASRGEIPNGITPSPGVKLMPRLNFAWDVRGDGDVVLRGGTGLFYSRPAGNFQYYVISEAPNVFRTSAYYWDVPGGLTLSNLSTIDPWSRLAASNVNSLDPDSIHVPRTWNWSLALAKRLPWEQTLEVAYVGSRSDHLPNRGLGDYIEPGSLTGTIGNADLDDPLHRVALDTSVAASFRSFPAYSDILLNQYEAWSTYHSLQATLSRPGGRHLSYFVNYTFSKALGITGDDFAFIDPLDPGERSYGLLPEDRTHIFNASWNLSFPDPVSAGGNTFLRHALNGWQLSGIASYRSGRPFRVGFSGEINTLNMQRAWWGTDAHLFSSDDNSGAVTPTFAADPRLGNTDVGERFLDVDQIGIPAFGESGPFQQPYEFRAPTRWNWDLMVSKNFPFGGSRKLQIRVGFFNLFNQAIPDITRDDIDLDLMVECDVRVDGVPNGAGGTTDGVCDPSQGFHLTDLTLENFGRILTKRGRRVIELAVRLDF